MRKHYKYRSRTFIVEPYSDTVLTIWLNNHRGFAGFNIAASYDYLIYTYTLDSHKATHDGLYVPHYRSINIQYAIKKACDELISLDQQFKNYEKNIDFNKNAVRVAKQELVDFYDSFE